MKWSAALDQPELSAEAAQGKGADPFAGARAEHPDDRLMLFRNPRTGLEFVMAVPPSSPWHALLPPEQHIEIQHADGSERSE